MTKPRIILLRGTKKSKIILLRGMATEKLLHHLLDSDRETFTAKEIMAKGILPESTLYLAIKRLIEQGLISPVGTAALNHSPGPAPTVYRLNL